jgi:hypothetical protein
LTLTEKFTREVLVNYFSLKSEAQGGVLDTDQLLVLVEPITTKAVQAGIQGPKFTVNDIDIVDSNSGQSLRNYGNALGALLTRHAHVSETNEIEVFYSSVAKGGNVSRLAEMDPFISSYRNFMSEAVALPVPSNIAVRHLALMNSLYSYSDVLKKLRHMEKDPLLAIVSLGEVVDNVQEVLTSLEDIKNFFVQKDITFGVAEPGYAITNY